MAISPENRARYRAILLSRAYKDLLAGVIPRGRIYNWLFRGENGDLRRVGEHVLADLRTFCLLDEPTIFEPDPMIMARREGRREVGLRIMHMLNLDEQAVQQLMRLDDGLE